MRKEISFRIHIFISFLLPLWRSSFEKKERVLEKRTCLVNLQARRKETEREREIKKGKKVYTRNAIIGRRPEGANGIKPAFPYSWPISCVVLLLLPSLLLYGREGINETINLVCCVHTTCARTFISGRVIRPRDNRWAVCDTAAAGLSSGPGVFLFIRSVEPIEGRGGKNARNSFEKFK